MPDKPFKEWTTEEAEEIARQIISQSHSVEEVKQRLTEAGFEGREALIYPQSGPGFRAIVIVKGPRGEKIAV